MNQKITIAFFFLITLGLAGLYYLHFAEKNSIAYVDSSKLLSSYQGMVDARGVYQGKVAIWQANIDTLTQDVQAAIQAYEKESRTMSSKEKELSQQLLKNKQQQLISYQKSIQEKAKQEDQQMTQKVLIEVNSHIEQYGKDKGYKVILVANESGNIAYAQDGMDITEELISQLNDNYIK